MANKKFSSLNSQYEMSLGYDSVVQLCADEPQSMPKIRYAFVPPQTFQTLATFGKPLQQPS